VRGREPELAPGGGLGLRWEFLEQIAEADALPADFFEIAPENYLARGGLYPALLERVAERYALTSHGLSLSIGGSAPLDGAYLLELRALLEHLGCRSHSDHLCFTSAGDRHLHELMPLKLCHENVRRVVERARQVEDVLGLPLALENITSYAHPGQREMSEAEFLSEVLEGANAGLLLDLNNVYVNACNRGQDPLEFLRQVPLERVRELHVAGHDRRPRRALGGAPDAPARDWWIDTHGSPVCDAVLELLGWTLARTGPVPVLLERDQRLPPLDDLLAEVTRVRGVYDRALATYRAPARRDAICA
jgi:uncharacterized protein (UPF0276 family)